MEEQPSQDYHLCYFKEQGHRTTSISIKNIYINGVYNNILKSKFIFCFIVNVWAKTNNLLHSFNLFSDQLVQGGSVLPVPRDAAGLRGERRGGVTLRIPN